MPVIRIQPVPGNRKVRRQIFRCWQSQNSRTGRHRLRPSRRKQTLHIYISSRSALSYFTKTITRKFAMLKKLTCIAYCAFKIYAIFVICLYFLRGQRKCCRFHWKKTYLCLVTLIRVAFNSSSDPITGPIMPTFRSFWSSDCVDYSGGLDTENSNS